MRAITVAIADDNREKRAKYEHALQGAQGIMVLTDIAANESDITRIRRLNPRVLLVSLKEATDADCAMLNLLRRECPEMRMILLTDESVIQEDQVMQALAKGAHGYLNPEADPVHISKAVHVIDRGEAWVPRRMLGGIMDQYWALASLNKNVGIFNKTLVSIF